MAKQLNPMLGIDAKMYRHFAIITVALTAAVALFADGEKREVIAQGVEDVRNYEPKKKSPKDAKLTINNDNVSDSGGMGGFYSSGAGDFSSQLSADSSVKPRGLRRGANHTQPTAIELATMEMTLEEFMSKSPEERAALIHMVRRGETAVDREAAIRDATTNSLSRSGGSEGAGEDY